MNIAEKLGVTDSVFTCACAKTDPKMVEDGVELVSQATEVGVTLNVASLGLCRPAALRVMARVTANILKGFTDADMRKRAIEEIHDLLDAEINSGKGH